MLNNEDELQSRSGCDEVEISCSNCGHSYRHHVTLYGVSIPCDAEDYWEFDNAPNGLCCCSQYQPLTSSDIREAEEPEVI